MGKQSVCSSSGLANASTELQLQKHFFTCSNCKNKNIWEILVLLELIKWQNNDVQIYILLLK